MITKFSCALFLSLGLLACSDGNPTENATEVGISSPAEVRQEQAAAPPRGDTQFKDGMTGKVYQDYLHLRTALVNSDAAEAGIAAGNLAEALGSDHADLKRAASVISRTDELDAQRAAFADLSEGMAGLLDGALSAGTIYQQHCPMAFDGRGANWYSDVAEVRNPYYGDKMLTCGKVVAKIQ